MRKLRSHRPSPAMIVACIALIAAVGGSAYAAKKIGTKQLKNRAVGTKKLKNKAVGTLKLKNRAVTTPKLHNGAVTLAKLAFGATAVWAKIEGDNGSILEGSGGIPAERLGAGSYIVDLGVDLRQHAPLTAIAELNNGQIGIQRCGPGGLNCIPPAGFSNSADTVLVQTSNGTGGASDRDFYIAAIP